eukprot:scaffold1019_cov172-Amphora_coffeaeformis.AAC.13
MIFLPSLMIWFCILIPRDSSTSFILPSCLHVLLLLFELHISPPLHPHDCLPSPSLFSAVMTHHHWRAVPNVSSGLRAEFARGDGRVKRKEDERKKVIAPSETLFVVNFNEAKTKRENLQMLFEPYGELLRIDMKKNYAFVQFRTIEQATRAKTATDGGKLDQAVITVEYVARQRADDGGRRNDRSGSGGDRRGFRRDGGRDDRRGPPPPHMMRGPPPPMDRYDRRYGGYDDRYRRGPPPPPRRPRSRSRSRSPGRYGGYRDRSPPRGRPRYDDHRGGGRRSPSPGGPPGDRYPPPPPPGDRYRDRRSPDDPYDRDRGYRS